MPPEQADVLGNVKVTVAPGNVIEGTRDNKGKIQMWRPGDVLEVTTDERDRLLAARAIVDPDAAPVPAVAAEPVGPTITTAAS